MKVGAKASIVAAALLTSAALGSCSRQTSPPEPFVRATVAYDALFGEIPPFPPSPGPVHATVVYFPSTLEPGKFRAVPIFSVDQGKEEALAVRTAIRGIDSDEGPVDALLEEIDYPFPPGSDLLALSHEEGVARIRIGGRFRADTFSAAEGKRAAQALALTVSQFGRTARVEVTDDAGTARFAATAEDAETAGLGLPKVLGLMAIRLSDGEPPAVLAVLFDRPAFVEEIGFRAPGADAAIAGKVYSTGFGMTAELHPDPPVLFEGGKAYRVRFAVRDGKGRRAVGEAEWIPRVVTRH